MISTVSSMEAFVNILGINRCLLLTLECTANASFYVEQFGMQWHKFQNINMIVNDIIN